MATRRTLYLVLLAIVLPVSACGDLAEFSPTEPLFPAVFQRDKTATVTATVPDVTGWEKTVRESAALAGLQCGNVPLTVTGTR